MRHAIVQLQTRVGKAKLSMREVAGTVVHGMEVVIAMIIVAGAWDVQPGLQPVISITFRPLGMAQSRTTMTMSQQWSRSQLWERSPREKTIGSSDRTSYYPDGYWKS
jgi:hypothetical protein